MQRGRWQLCFLFLTVLMAPLLSGCYYDDDDRHGRHYDGDRDRGWHDRDWHGHYDHDRDRY